MEKDETEPETPALGVLPGYLFVCFLERQVIYADNCRSALFCENALLLFLVSC